MFAKILSAHLLGIEGVGVDVEADVSSVGLPSFAIVGLAEGALKESRERVRASLKNLGYNIFAKPVTVNLAPADFKKEGSHFDLPIALGLLAATDNLGGADMKSTLILGELSLDGRLRGVSGVLPMAEWAASAGIKRIILPMDNAAEASLIEGLDVYSFDTLGSVIGFLRGEIAAKPYVGGARTTKAVYGCDFSDVKGQFAVRRGAEIAASGMHNIIFIGSPGSGKTMIARRMPTILPPMSVSEALRTTKIYSAAGLLKEKGRLVSERPFVSPHHTASAIAIIGGGPKAKPGQVSISSGGVLFLDEMLEFGRSVLEVLRQPLEDRCVTVARAGRTVTYPADFMLIGAMNPCPCGYFGDKKRECSCTPPSIERYKARLSGPMLDRIDLHVRVASVDYKDLSEMKVGESSETIRQRVAMAHEIQRERFKDSNIAFNSGMTEKQIGEFCRLDDKCAKILEDAMNKFALSARAYSKVLKTARTIADMSSADNIAPANILEALQFRIADWQ